MPDMIEKAKRDTKGSSPPSTAFEKPLTIVYNELKAFLFLVVYSKCYRRFFDAIF